MMDPYAGVNQPIVVIDLGNQFAQGTFPRRGIWYGLYCTALACELREAGVEIGDGSARNVLDEDEALDVIKVPGSGHGRFKRIVAPSPFLRLLSSTVTTLSFRPV
jgi:hypothetical protein